MMVELSDRNVFQFVSPSCRQLLGQTDQELTNKDMMNFVHPADKALVKQVRNSVYQAPPTTPKTHLSLASNSITFIHTTQHTHTHTHTHPLTHSLTVVQRLVVLRLSLIDAGAGQLAERAHATCVLHLPSATQPGCCVGGDACTCGEAAWV